MRLRLIILSGLFFIAWVLGARALADARVPFTFAYEDREGYPSFMGNGTDIPTQRPGTYIDLLRLVAERVPIELKLERYPWERCKAFLKSNRVDAINSSFKESRSRIGVFPVLPNGEVDTQRRITSDSYRLYTLKDSELFYDPHRNNFVNLGKGISAPLGYSIVSELQAKGIPIQAHTGASTACYSHSRWAGPKA